MADGRTLVNELMKMANAKRKEITQAEAEARVWDLYLNNAFGYPQEISSGEQEALSKVVDDWLDKDGR